MYLSNELMKVFGEPYASSITVVRRFGKGTYRVYVDYERERNEVNFQSFVAMGGVTLAVEDAMAFIQDIEKISPFARTYRMDIIGKSVNIFPLIEFSCPLGIKPENTIEKRIQRVVDLVRKCFDDLRKIEAIMVKYKTKEVGYPEVINLWQAALSVADHNEKGRLLEQIFVRLFQLDGSFIVLEHNIRTETEEIDIVVQPDTSSPFWSKVSPPMLLLECKNWKEKIGTKELQVFATKIENRPKILCRIGYLISISGFTNDAEKELIGYRARDFVIATITSEHIEDLMKKRKRISDLLKERLIEAGFR